MTSTKNVLFTLCAVAALSLAIGACKKKDEDKKAKPTNKAQPTTKTPDKATAKTTTTKKKMMPKDVRPKPDSDYIIVEATHAKKKPSDPVTVNFRKFKITKANFDPKKIVGGSAELEIDIGSMESGIVKRDNHLKSDEYFDSSKFTTATISIADVKKAGDKKYSANAKISLHGITATRAIEFEVVSTTADSVRIKAEHKLKRIDFKLGKASGDSVADEVVVKLQLTVKKS